MFRKFRINSYGILNPKVFTEPEEDVRKLHYQAGHLYSPAHLNDLSLLDFNK